MIYLKRTLIFVLVLTAFKANAMWKLAQQISQQKALSWDERLLEVQDLDGLLEQALRRELNPNSSLSRSKETALTLACKKDMSGEKIKRLLAYGNIKMNMWESEEGIWSPLFYAVQEKNWQAVDILIACESLALSQGDLAFATRSLLEY